MIEGFYPVYTTEILRPTLTPCICQVMYLYIVQVVNSRGSNFCGFHGIAYLLSTKVNHIISAQAIQFSTDP